MLTFAFMHYPYLVCILFGMPSLHLFTFLMDFFKVLFLYFFVQYNGAFRKWTLNWSMQSGHCNPKRLSAYVGKKILADLPCLHLFFFIPWSLICVSPHPSGTYFWGVLFVKIKIIITVE